MLITSRLQRNKEARCGAILRYCTLMTLAADHIFVLGQLSLHNTSDNATSNGENTALYTASPNF